MSILNIIDEDGNIIGQDTRENIHKKGFLHKEVHVIFYNLKSEIIFQLRSKNKDTFPNLLDVAAGGHVEINSDFIDTALQEMLEETGINTTQSKLKLMDTLRKKVVDPVTRTTNNVIRRIYVFEYAGDVGDLKIEKGEAQGFEVWKIDSLFNGLSSEQSKRFIPTVLDEDYLKIYRKIKDLL